ncbi:hypothetical protein ERO13_D02G042933v2, partial [Gossypium hirsutum]
LFRETYQLVEPSIKERDAVYESLTYSSKLYLSAGLFWKTSKDIQEQTIFIGNIPLMNSLGTFIVNRIYRIVINQILQSPGIYYQSELEHNGISVYTGTIISDWGGRLELEVDKKAKIWARISKKQKISILIRKKNWVKRKCHLEFYQQFSFVGGNLVFSESLCKELQKKFFQQICELERIGRQNMDQKLNLNIPQNNTFFLLQDILAATNRLIGMKFGMGTLDDMNHLKNKRIHFVADLLQDQFGLALVCLENVVRGTICGAIRLLDQTNPLTQIVHGRNLSYLGPGGLIGQTANFRIRDIHPNHYGRICPIGTSEGINVGLIGSLAIHARIENLYEIKKKAQMLYLSPSQDECYMVAVGNSLALNQGIQEEQVVPTRYRQEFLTI